MKHFIYLSVVMVWVLFMACKGDQKHEEPIEAQAAAPPTETVVPDNTDEIEAYRAKIDIVLKDVDTKIAEHKEQKLLEKDKQKKEDHTLAIKFLQELKDDLQAKKNEFDSRKKLWREFKEELDYIFSRNPSDDRNDPDRIKPPKEK